MGFFFSKPSASRRLRVKGLLRAPGCEACQELPVSLHEIELAQGFARGPVHLLEDQVERLAGEFQDAVEDQIHGGLSRICEFVAGYHFARGAGDSELFFKLRSEER